MAEGSLLSPDPNHDPQARLSFFDELDADAKAALIAHEDNNGEFTAARFFEREPRLYKAVVCMLGADFKVQTIARLLSVSDNTVRAVRDNEVASIADFRAKQGKRRRSVMGKLLDRIDEKADSAELKDAVIAYAILDDKERLDSGSPTQIVGSVTAQPPEEKYRALLASMGLAPAIDVAAEVTPVTGSTGGSREQTRADPPADPPPSDPGPQPPPRDT